MLIRLPLSEVGFVIFSNYNHYKPMTLCKETDVRSYKDHDSWLNIAANTRHYVIHLSKG